MAVMTLSQNFKMFFMLGGMEQFHQAPLRIILMKEGFVWNRVLHNWYSDVAGSEVANGAGYGTTGQALTLALATFRDDASFTVQVKYNNVMWIASGGKIASQGALLYVAKAVPTNAQPTIGYIDFIVSQGALDGYPFVVSNIGFAI